VIPKKKAVIRLRMMALLFLFSFGSHHLLTRWRSMTKGTTRPTVTTTVTRARPLARLRTRSRERPGAGAHVMDVGLLQPMD